MVKIDEALDIERGTSIGRVAESQGLRKGKGERWRPSDLSLKLAKFTFELNMNQLDRKVIDHTCVVIRDTLGTMLAGASLPEVRGLAEMADNLGAEGYQP